MRISDWSADVCSSDLGGIGAQRDGLGLVGLARQLLAQQRRRLRLGDDLGLEVEARRVAEPGMARPREAVDAAVLAAAVGIDGEIGRASRRERGCQYL